MFGSLLAGKIGYAAGCVLAATALLVSGYAFHVEGQVSDVASSHVDAGGPEVGDMNILLMGLESRTYWNGQPLPRTLTDIMHAGSAEFGVGGNTANTLILLHIYDNGKKATGISIPRDDVVTMYGTHGYGGTTAKIDEAYGDAMSYELQQLQQDGQAAKMSRDQLYFQANEAGRAAQIQTVEALTGVHIDHFAELNLWGFYELASIFGPIEVCLKQAASDPAFSGANILAGYHALSAAQALAFVRQRENLPNGDLDRTHRQQAVLDYVIWKVKHQNLVADLVEGNALLNDLKTFMITSGGWNIVEFATEMQNLTGRNLVFQTLPIQTQENNVMLNGRLQDINIVDPAYLQQWVHNLLNPAPPAKPATGKSASAKVTTPIPPASTVTVDVYNGGSTRGLAGSVSQALVSAGYKAGAVENSSAQSEPVQSATQVFYGTGTSANAIKIAGYFGATATAATSVPAGHVEILLGTAASTVPSGIVSSSASPGATTTAGASPSATPSATSTANDGQAGGVITVKANAPYGIPCVD
jgi:LCP family protein required for cell wall assembly